MNRRQVIVNSLKVVGLGLVAPAFVKSVLGGASAVAQEKRRAAPSAGGGSKFNMVDTNDSVAKAVKYVEDAAKSPDAKGNKCSTCNFYKKVGDNGGKEAGTCTIFAGKHVYANGYCGSWAKKS